MSAKPFFQADQVGSLLRPQKLLDARNDWKTNKITRADLRLIEDQAIEDCVKLQEEIGLNAVTDGEFRRENWWIDFTYYWYFNFNQSFTNFRLLYFKFISVFTKIWLITFY